MLARQVEHVAGEREVLGPRRPERRHAAVDDAEREQPARQARLALHRVQVARDVLPRERHPRDEVVEHEVMEDDDAGRRRSASTIHPWTSGLFPTW